MKKKLFLIGPSGCGKTTMIENALGGSASFAGGFITRRIKSEDGKIQGYELLPAAAAAGITGFEGKIFLDYSVLPPVSDNEVFRVEGVRLLQEAMMYPFALLDEFGGFELIIPQFREALLELLNSPLPCIGVLKAAPNAADLRASLGLGQRYTEYRNALEAALMRDEDTLLLHVDSYEDRKILNLLRAWCSEYCL